MNNSCILIPTVNVNGREVESRLYKDLSKAIGREAAITVWSAFSIEAVKKEFKDLEYDENGEPTAESIFKALGSNGINLANNNIDVVRVIAGATDADRNIIDYDNPSVAMGKAISFNKEQKNFKATVTHNISGKYNIIIDVATKENISEAAELPFKNSLNEKIRNWLKEAGFAIGYDNGIMNSAGILDPLNTETTADNLRKVIRIVHGEEGENAIPEEFSHLVIEGMKNTPLVGRLINTVTNELAVEVLGDSYDRYYKLYNGDLNIVRREAAAHILEEALQKKNLELEGQPLVSRVWHSFLNIFKNHSVKEIDHMMESARAAASDVSEELYKGSLMPLIDYDTLLESPVMHKLNKRFDSLKDLADEANRIAAKRLKLARYRNTIRNTTDSRARLAKMEQNFAAAKYYKSISMFLEDARSTISDLDTNLSIYYKTVAPTKDSKIFGKQLRDAAILLIEINEFKTGYQDIIMNLTLADTFTEIGSNQFTKEQALEVRKTAEEILHIIHKMDKIYDSARFNTVYAFLKNYWGEDKIINCGSNKGEALTLEYSLKNISNDLGWFDRLVSALGDASDPMLSLIDVIVKDAHSKRDDIVNDHKIAIMSVNKDLMDAGFHDTKFMYQMDDKGVPTGWLISPYNFSKFYEDKRKFKETLLMDTPKNLYDAQEKMRAWEAKRVHKADVYGKTMDVPYLLDSSGHNIYASDAVDNLKPAQKVYYEKMMRIKAMREVGISERKTNLFKAIQISTTMMEGLQRMNGSTMDKVKMFLEKTKEQFIRSSRDTQFGEEEIDDGVKLVTLGFDDREISRLPLYYTNRLKDMNMLSLDFTAGIMAYSAMAIDFEEMNKVVNLLELSREQLRDRKLIVTEHGEGKFEKIKSIGRNFISPYVKEGSYTEAMKRLDKQFEAVIYQKSDSAATWSIFGQDVLISKATDLAKSYVSTLGLGLNPFAATANVTMGKVQLAIEAAGSEYFGWRDLIASDVLYWKLLPGYMAELNSTVKTSKLSLLMNKFDPLENNFDRAKHMDFTMSPSKRIIGKFNVQFMMGLGEHYLHTQTMLAMMHNYKLKNSTGKTITMLNAFDEVAVGNGKKLTLKSGLKKLDGSDFTENDVREFKIQMQKINKTMNGAFNDIDKGVAQRSCIGKLAMQFRQWMPEHYYRRFASSYYSAELGKTREGYYRTYGRFIWELMKDVRRMKFMYLTHYHELDPTEQANVRRARAEIAMFIVTALILGCMPKLKDNKGLWWMRMVEYQLKRLKLDIGASTPINTKFFTNIETILQSPMAAIDGFNNIGNLLCIWNIGNEITTGRYKGWSEYLRDLIETIPIYNQITRMKDLSTENYMFTVLDR